MVKKIPSEKEKLNYNKTQKGDGLDTKDMLFSFLKKIKDKSDIIKKKNNSKYSLLCCLLLSFYNNGKLFMDKRLLYESVKKEIEDYGNKVISSFANNCKYPETINPKNCTSKLNMLLANTRCFELLDDKQIKLNEEYIIKKRQRIYNYSFNTNLNMNKLGMKRRIFKRIKKSSKRKKDETKFCIKTNSKKKHTEIENIFENRKDKEENDHFIDIEIDDMNDFESTEQISQDNNINIKEKEDENIKDKSNLKDEVLTPQKDSKYKYSNQNKIDCLITPKFMCKNNKENINQGKIIKDNLNIKLFCFIQKAEEFLNLILNEKFYDSLMNISRPVIQILVNYINEINIINYIKNAKNDYFELKKYCESLFWNSIDNCSSKNDILSLIKKCRLLVYVITTRLSLFILDFDFIQKIINNYLEKYNDFKIVKIFMNENIKVLNQEYINELEKLFEINLNNILA